MSADKSAQITIPMGWKEDRYLHDSAELQSSNRSQESYIIVLSESKEDFDQMTLEKHSEITRATLMQSLTGPELGSPVRLTIHNQPALQYEIRGTINNLKVVYVHTTVETAGHFHQILAWTLRSKFEKNRPLLLQLTNSFHELP